ncbi:hypothetical protein HY486_04180 [Candidatus Woesearchaeota archaeon]|nr:hypothetical protein [Candidatus Woesearchaeota archaeon]
MHQKTSLVLFALASVIALFVMFSSTKTGMLHYSGHPPSIGIGETLGSKMPVITERMLNTGAITGSRKAEYYQTIAFSRSGVFDGGQVEVIDGRNAVVFRDSVFLYTLIFSDGLVSRIDGTNLTGIHGKKLKLLGSDFYITHATYLNNELRLVLTGPVVLDISDTDDREFSQGVRINGRIAFAKARMSYSKTSDLLTIRSIEYLVDAVPAPVEVYSGESVKSKLSNPEAFLESFDLTYGGKVPVEAVIEFIPSGRGYDLVFINSRGKRYKTSFVENNGAGLVYGKGTKTLHAAEGSNIQIGDYAILTSKNDLSGITRIVRLDSITDEQVIFRDYVAGQVIADYQNNEGILRADGVEYLFTVSGKTIKLDQNSDGSITTASIPIIASGGTQLSLGSEGSSITVTYTAPGRLFEERVAESITFIFEQDGSRTNARTSLETFLDKDRIAKGMTNLGAIVLLDSTKGPARVSIMAPGRQSRGTIGVAGT